MKHLTASFAKGLLIVAPVALTIWIVYFIVDAVDSLFNVKDWFGFHFPGLGVLLTLVAITLVGVLASNAIGKRVFELMEAALCKIPVVKLLFGSLKDLLNAFVGDTPTFRHPVSVKLGPSARLFGFVTSESFPDPRLKNHIAVYVPQSYAFAGNVIIVDRSAVEPLDADGAQLMAFIVSGGVASLDAASTVLEMPTFNPRESAPPGK